MSSHTRFLKRMTYELSSRGRLVGSIGHRNARELVVARFGELGLAPYSGDSFSLPYRDCGRELVNIVGVVKSGHSHRKPVLIGAHYDSVIDAPSADDNAAAVAISLLTAEILGKTHLERDVVIAVFDAEEPPYFQTPSMGSIRFYEDHAGRNGIHAAVIMDLVGHDVVVPFSSLPTNLPSRMVARTLPRIQGWDVPIPIIKDLLFITGAESHPALEKILEQTRVPRRLRVVPTLNSYIGDMSDQGVFRTSGVPYLFLSCGRWRHYHMKTDTPDRLNYRKMSRITRYLMHVVRALCRDGLSPSCEPADTTAFEIRALKRALGPLFPIALRMVGIKQLNCREDVDALVDALLATGL
jgi:peptidase M28-like protein